jgi:hypothetical protein
MSIVKYPKEIQVILTAPRAYIRDVCEAAADRPRFITFLCRNLINRGCLFYQNDIQRFHFGEFRKIIKQIKCYYIMPN